MGFEPRKALSYTEQGWCWVERLDAVHAFGP